MEFKRAVRAGGTASVTVLVTAGVAFVGGEPPARASGGPPVVLSGQVAGGGSDMYVAVYALPKTTRASMRAGSASDLYRLPSSAISVSGSSYSVRLDKASLPTSVRTRLGDVTFMVLAENQKTLRYAVTTATARYTPASVSRPARWIAPAAPADPARLSGRAIRSSGVELTTKVAHPASTPARVGRTTALRSSVDTVGQRAAWGTIGTGYPVGGSSSWMSFTDEDSSSLTASFGVAISSSLSEGVDASASWTQSGTRSITSGFGFEWDRSTKARRYQLGVTYVHNIVHLSDLECYQGAFCSYSMWVPGRFNGGTRSKYRIKRPNWRRHCIPESKGTWKRWRSDGHSFTMSGGAQLAFLNWSGSSERAYSRHVELLYYSRGNQRLCGNNDDPPFAGMIEQKRKG